MQPQLGWGLVPMYHYLRMGGPPGQEVPTLDPHPDQKTLSSQDEERLLAVGL